MSTPPSNPRRSAADEWSRTIVAFDSPYRMKELVLPLDPTRDAGAGMIEQQQQFKIRLAANDTRRHSASLVVQKMYASRGYETSELKLDPNRITMLVSADDRVIGTATLGLDSEQGLMADDIYKAEVDAIRARGRNVAELTKLAIDDSNVDSKHIVAALFHICYIYGHNIHGVTDFIIEINPRHAVFYKRTLGFEQIGEERVCARVNAPAVLLHLPLEHVEQCVGDVGGTLKATKGDKSLYPYCFSRDDEEGITHRLIQGE
jgi:hypothetical protein